jgi:hypothetical protein
MYVAHGTAACATESRAYIMWPPTHAYNGAPYPCPEEHTLLVPRPDTDGRRVSVYVRACKS